MCYNKCIKILYIGLFQTIVMANPYQYDCKECHLSDQQMGMFFGKYMLQYSSEKKIKEELFSYLKDPTEEKSLMPMGFLNRFGIKEKSTLSDKELQTAIDSYFKIYAPKYRLK